MDIAGRATSVVLRAAAAIGLGVAVLAVILGGIGFLSAGAFIDLTQRLGAAEAAAVTGGALIILALVIAVIGAWALKKYKKRRPGMLAEFNATFGLGARLIALLVRRDPKKAVLFAALAGAIMEYLLSDDTK